MATKNVFRQENIDFSLDQSVTLANGGCEYTGGGVSVYCFHDGFLYQSGSGVRMGHMRRAKIYGGSGRLYFYDCDVPEDVWELVKIEDVPIVVIDKMVEYVSWTFVGV